MASDKGKKANKSKLSKPSPKQKHQQYCIEVTVSAVKVLKMDQRGKVTSAGYVQLQGDAIWADRAWIGRLSQSIKDAAKAAKVPMGSTPCAIVVGGPFVVMQKFTWPELDHAAMLDTAKHEIASYLPGTASNFVIGAEVMAKNDAVAGNAPSMDVFVAAIPKDVATAVSTAADWAGFRVITVDACENVRVRVINKYCRISATPPRSYGLLDIYSESPSLTLYLDGNFYSTHYFTGIDGGGGFQTGQTVDEIESMMGSLESVNPTAKTSEKNINIDAVLNEINFVVDFIKYQERGSNLECILSMSTINSDIVHRLSTGLDIPTYSLESWMEAGVITGVKGDPGLYLDVFGVGIPSQVIAQQHMMNLKAEAIEKNPGAAIRKLAGIMLLSMIVLFSILLLFPFILERRAIAGYNALNAEDERVRIFEEPPATPTDAQIAALQASVDFYSIRLDGIYNFYAEFAQASVVVPIIFSSGEENFSRANRETGTGFSSISRLSVSNDNITVEVTARYFEHVAELLEDLRAHPLFRYALTQSVQEADTRDQETGTASWSVSIIMRRGMGTDFDD